MVFLQKIIALLVLVFALWGCPSGQTTVIIRDTTRVIERITIDSFTVISKPNIIIDDTTKIITTNPFTVRVDTVIYRTFRDKLVFDTIRWQYSFPSNTTSIQYNPMPDSIWSKIINNATTEFVKTAWWEYLLMILGGVLGGFIIFLIYYVMKNRG